MKKKAQVYIFYFMLAFIIYIAVYSLITPIKSIATTAMDSNNLNCSSASLSDGDKGTCILAGFTPLIMIGIPLFVIILLILNYRSKQQQQ